MAEPRTGQTRGLGGPVAELPSYLRLALERYAQDVALGDDPSGATRIIPRVLSLDCEVRTADDSDATGHNGGVHRTHEDFGPRLPRSHDRREPNGC